MSRPVFAAGLTGLLLVTMLVLRVSGAAFSGSTVNPSNSFGAATVTVSDNDSGTLLLDTTAMLPGDTKQTCVRVSYTGTVDATVRLYGTVTGTLPQYLNLTVERGSGASAFGDCTGFSATATVYSGTVAGLAAAHTSWTDGAGSYTAAASSSQWFRIVWTLQDVNAAQGQSASATYTWEARSGAVTTNFRSTTASSTATVPAVQLAPASNLSATAGCTTLPSARWVDLSWSASSPATGVTQYRVYRSTSGGAFSSVHTTTGTTWQDTGLTNGTTYDYYIVAERAGTTWVAAASNTASATTAADLSCPL